MLAKSEKAKKAGIKTGMPNWEALQKCPDLVIVPPRFEYYAEFSRLLHGIYERYTDYIESFGLDECWLDVTDNIKSPMEIAEEIRQAVKDELGLTVSIGVSFNKVFAKLGSDLKKPDAITEITKENFKKLVWPLPCSELLYCGRQTTLQLEKMAVHTIGQLATLPLEYVVNKFGKNGHSLWVFANGLDDSPVAHMNDYEMPKSIGHGVTCVENLESYEEANKVIVSLCQDIGYKLRKGHLCASGVALTVKDKNLTCQTYQARLSVPTQDELTISQLAYDLLLKNYSFREKIRALTVTAINISEEDTPVQSIMLFDYGAQEKRNKLNTALDELKSAFGKDVIKPAVILDEHKMPKNRQADTILPGMMKKK